MIRSGPHLRYDRTGRKPRTGRNMAAARPAWGIVAGTVCASARPTLRGFLPMSSILSRFVAIGIIAGGFALTGDLGKLAKRGLDVVNSRDVPTATPEESGMSPAATALADAATRDVERIVATAEAVANGSPAHTPAPPGSPQGKAVIARDADFRPPQHGIDTIELSSLTAGNRVVVWLAMPRRSGGRAYRCLVFDVVDPSSGHRRAAPSRATPGRRPWWRGREERPHRRSAPGRCSRRRRSRDDRPGRRSRPRPLTFCGARRHAP